LVVERGEIWWADLADPVGSAPGYRRPVVIVQADSFNRSRLRTLIGVTLTSNLYLVDAPGNVLLPAGATGLPKDSVANVSQLATIDRERFTERVGRISGPLLRDLEKGLRLVLGL
jgi:mRNA interferase MazF